MAPALELASKLLVTTEWNHHMKGKGVGNLSSKSSSYQKNQTKKITIIQLAEKRPPQ